MLVLIPRNYSRPRTEIQQTQDGYRRADQGRLEDKERQRLDCDIDIGDGTVDDTQQDINDREVLGTSKGNVTESHRASTTTMTMKLAYTEVKETIGRTTPPPLRTRGAPGARGKGPGKGRCRSQA